MYTIYDKCSLNLKLMSDAMSFPTSLRALVYPEGKSFSHLCLFLDHGICTDTLVTHSPLHHREETSHPQKAEKEMVHINYNSDKLGFFCCFFSPRLFNVPASPKPQRGRVANDWLQITAQIIFTINSHSTCIFILSFLF